MGLPIEHFVAATNVNDTVPRFLENGVYDPKPSKATISNAMDETEIIQEAISKRFRTIQKRFFILYLSDEETLEAMKTIYKRDGYIAEPHGAVGYLGLKRN
jgi:threonine synthase